MKHLVESRLHFRVSGAHRVDHYRLNEGRVQFQADGAQGWKTLDYPDIQYHLELNTPVAKWLGHLTSLGETARFLSSQAAEEL
jgi:hypothetical protein